MILRFKKLPKKIHKGGQYDYVLYSKSPDVNRYLCEKNRPKLKPLFTDTLSLFRLGHEVSELNSDPKNSKEQFPVH